MRSCPCGGSLSRHRKAVIKTTGEQVVTLLCRGCGQRVSIYTNLATGEKVEQKRAGRPALPD
jgi:hypothetical protein